MPNNMEFDKNSQGPNKGVSGYAENQLARNRVNRFAFGTGDNQESGFLNDAIQNADALIQKIKEVEKALGGANKVTEKMTETQRKAYEHSKSDAKLLSDTMKEVQRTGTLSQAELNQLIKDNEKISKESIKTLTNLINSMDKTSSENVKDQKKLIEETNLAIQKQNEQITKSKQEMKELNQELKDTQDTFTKGLGNTLKSAGDTLGKWSAILNLQNISNNAMEQNARSKAAIMNEVNKQFGFTSNGQFESFKNSLVGSLKDMNSEMGNLFNSNDLKNYMSNLAQYGVTDTKMAQDQMRASIVGNKYLGVSAETQEMIFKYLKRTNNNDAINEHNRMVVGLLNSQLGVSKEQLDALTQTTYSDMEAMRAAGVGEEAIENYKTSSNVTKTALESINKGWGESFGNILTDITSKPLTELTNQYSAIFGSSLLDARNTLFSSGDAVKATEQLLTSEQFRNILNQGNANAVQEVLSSFGFTNTEVANMVRYFQNSENNNNWNQKVTEALESIKNTSDSDVTNYVEQSTEATWLEKIQNQLDTFFTSLPWGLTMGLANVAFGMYIAGGAIDMIKGAKDFFGGVSKNGGLGSLFSKFFGSGSAVSSTAKSTGALAKGGSGLLASGGGILLGAAASAALIAAVNAGVQAANKSSLEHGEYAGAQDVKGTKYEGNSTVQSLMTSAEVSDDRGWLQNSWNNMTGGIGYFGAKLFGGTAEKNKKLTQWMASSDTFGKGNEAAGNMAIWGLMMNQLGYFDSFQEGMKKAGVGDWSKSKPEDLAALLVDNGWTKTDVESRGNKILSAGWKPYSTDGRMESFNFDPSKVGLENTEGYHKAGLNWVPRDNYRALLHKGEMILNAREAAMYRKNFGYGGSLNANASDYVGPHHSGYAGHNGIDLYFGEIGTPVGSAVAGRVIESKDIPVNWNDGKMHGKDSNGTAYSSYGRVVKVLGDDGHTYIYGHLNERRVNTGDIVSAGTLLGYSGTTGNSSGPHLHFEVAGAGTGEAAHAKYYTPFVRNVTGAAGSTNIADSDSNASAVNTLGSRRYIPKSLSSGGFGGSEGASQIVNSVDGGFDKLIKYLDSISKEQNEQRALLETYSIAKGSESNY